MIVVYGNNIISKEIINYVKENQIFDWQKGKDFKQLLDSDLDINNTREVNAFFMDNKIDCFINCNFINDLIFCEENYVISYKYNVSNQISLNFYANLNKVPVVNVIDCFGICEKDKNILAFHKHINEFKAKNGLKSTILQFYNIFSSLSEDESLITSLLKDVLCGKIGFYTEDNLIDCIYSKSAVEEILKAVNYILTFGKHCILEFANKKYNLKSIQQYFLNYKNNNMQFLNDDYIQFKILFDTYQKPVFKVEEIKPIPGNFLSYLSLDSLFIPVLIDNE